MAASMTTLPVFGVPVESKALKGMDSLLSIVQMPAGIPVGIVASHTDGVAPSRTRPRRSPATSSTSARSSGASSRSNGTTVSPPSSRSGWRPSTTINPRSPSSAIWGTLRGFGPFASGPPTESLLLLLSSYDLHAVALDIVRRTREND